MNFENLNKKELDLQLKYFFDYYGKDFQFNQGTEEILEMIYKYSIPGNLIDFGSGSNIYFWLTAFKYIYNVKCVDISKEAFYINELIRNKKIFPKSINYPLTLFNIKYDDLLTINIEYYIKDMLNSHKNFIHKANNVSQFGLLGLSKNKKEYIRNFKILYSSLLKGGIFLNANWIFSYKYSISKSYSNSYLNENLVYEISKIVNGKCLYVKLIPISNDCNYDFVLIYAIKKI